MFHYTYKTVNLQTGDFYLGVRSSKKSPEEDPYLGSGIRITNAIKKHGRSSFKKEILATYPSRAAANDAEKLLIEKHLGDTNCYNIANGGNGWGLLGKRASAEVYERIAAKQRGVPKPKHRAETKRQISTTLKKRNGRGHALRSENATAIRVQMAETARRKFASGERVHHNLGKPLREETKTKISVTLRGNIPWNAGVPASKEARQKMSAAKKDRHDKLDARLKTIGLSYEWLVTNVLLLHSKGNGPIKILHALGLRGIMTESPIKAIIRKHR